MVTRIIKKILVTIDYFSDNFGKEHILPALSVVGTVLFILGFGYLMSHLVKVEEENIQKQERKTAEAAGKTEIIFGRI